MTAATPTLWTADGALAPPSAAAPSADASGPAADPPAAPYLVASGAPGARWAGLGHVSAGASSRLLFSYPEPILGDILDFLFLPSFGMATQLLKVEIGGDGQSTLGVEPSHAHSGGDVSFSRGYEWRLMAEARARNPSIQLLALAWAYPRWVGGGGGGNGSSSSPWDDIPRAVSYTVAWLVGARDAHNLTLDFIDADWNERGWSAPFVIALRAAMDAAGLASTRILCGDDAHAFACASAVLANATLARAVDVLGSHSPTTAAPAGTALPLWGSELEVADDGGCDTPPKLAALYLHLNVTGFLFWALVTSYYDGLFAFDQGAFLAYTPWCAHYELSGRAWTVAHYTQHIPVGWRFLERGGGSGALAGGNGSYLAFVDAGGAGGLTLVIHKPATDAGPETAGFTITGPAAGITSLHAWRSRMQAGRGADLSQYYLAQPGIVVSGGNFTLALAPGDLWTLTTNAGGAKGVRATPPAYAPFPAAYADDFDACAEFAEAPYWTDQAGAWECVPVGGGHGTAMRQVVPAHPIAWRNDEQRPLSILGDVNWAAADVAVDIRMPAAGDSALLGARANPNCCGRIITGEVLMPGVWLQVTAGAAAFAVFNSIANATANVSVSSPGVLLRGTLPAVPAPGDWHRLRLVVSAAGDASASIDGAGIFSGLAVQGFVPDTGFVGIGTADWGQFVDFDNANVTASA